MSRYDTVSHLVLDVCCAFFSSGSVSLWLCTVSFQAPFELKFPRASCIRAYQIADPSLRLQGYILIEYATLSEAKAAIEGANGTKLLDQTIAVDFAFVRPPPQKTRAGNSNAPKGASGRQRSRSPVARAEREEREEEGVE